MHSTKNVGSPLIFLSQPPPPRPVSPKILLAPPLISAASNRPRSPAQRSRLAGHGASQLHFHNGLVTVTLPPPSPSGRGAQNGPRSRRRHARLLKTPRRLSMSFQVQWPRGPPALLPPPSDTPARYTPTSEPGSPKCCPQGPKRPAPLLLAGLYSKAPSPRLRFRLLCAPSPLPPFFRSTISHLRISPCCSHTL